MKIGRALIRCGVLLGAMVLAARADNNVAVPTSVPPATAPTHTPPAATAPTPAASVSATPTTTLRSFPLGSENLPPADPTDIGTYDPERIAEQTYLQNQQKQTETTSPFDSEQSARQRAYDNDWMMRGYAEELKKRGLGESKEIDSVLVADPNAPKPGVARDEALLGLTEQKTKTTRRHSSSLIDSSDTLTPKKSLASDAYQPLIKPFDQASPSQAPNPWDSAASGLADLETGSGATLLPVPGTIPNGVSQHDIGANSEASMLDIPGLTAATRDAIAPNNALTFQDPGENEITNRQHPRTSANNNNFMLPVIPTNDISDFFKKQSDALHPPLAPNASTALVTPVHKILPLTPTPLTRPSQPSGMRLHVDDPFDILRR